MFKDYSVTYAANITTLAGLVASMWAMFNSTPVDPKVIEFVLGLVLNVGGVIWAIKHRYSKGDVTVLGRRI